MSSDRPLSKRRPPKKNIAEAIKAIEAEIELCRKRAATHQSLADNPPHARVDPAYCQRVANAAINKRQRLELVAAWMKDETS